jgi:antitoxin component of MazEF toxin-antitoxin module
MHRETERTMEGITAREGRIVQHGDSLALVLDPEVLEQLNITLETKLDVVTNGDSMIVTVRDEVHRAKLHRIMEEMNEQYSEVFRRLEK